MGWLHAPNWMQEQVPRLEAARDSALADGFTDALLLGMGGSSLAPELFARVFGASSEGLKLSVLDSTSPGAILNKLKELDPGRTLFLVSSKSGSTVETLSLFKYFYNWTSKAVGEAAAGGHFLTITDPGSKLVELGERYGFRDLFLNDPNIGGRYSALTYFGLVPAALAGVDVRRLLDRALDHGAACESCVSIADNPAARLGILIGDLAREGLDKLTLVLPAGLESFGDWVEQLIAESTGKDGRGIVPVVGEPLGPPQVYGNDRLFISIRLGDAPGFEADLELLEAAGHPVAQISLRDPYDLGGQFMLWEFATAVAGERLSIQPFDQPNVEAAKVLAREMVEAYRTEGALPASVPDFEDEGIAVFEAPGAADLESAITYFLERGREDSYIALQAFLPPTEETSAQLQALRVQLRNRTARATMLGYGPRYLHSTGQLHKGDAGGGLFLMLTADEPEDVAIPDQAGVDDSSLSFGVLKAAQALGDLKALQDAGRTVLRIHFRTDVVAGLERLLRAAGAS